MPVHDTIVEPFAGSAAYSLRGDNWQRRVILCDLDVRVAAVWQYLLQASSKDILALPDLMEGQSLDEFQSLTQAERRLIGFALRPDSGPRKTAGKYNRWPANKPYVASVVPRIKHWRFIHGDYRTLDALLPNSKASWFVDPSFQTGGEFYRHHEIDYPRLQEWCRQRKG